MKRKKLKINKRKFLTITFSLIFIISLFSSIVSFAKTYPLEINSINITDKSDDVTGEIINSKKDEITSSVVFHKLNGFATYGFNIKSNLEEDIRIITITDNNENEYIDYEYDKHENYKVNAKGSFDLAVKAVYKNELIDLSNRSQTSNVKLTIKYLDSKGEHEGEITINPKTGDRTIFNFILLLISGAGFIICISNNKNIKKRIYRVSILIISSLLITPFIARAATNSFNILLNNNIELLDKVIITINTNGEEKQIINNYGDIINGIENPTKEGYTFDKWTYEDGSDFDPTIPLTEDIKIVANFTANQYTISYDLNGGNTTVDNPTTYIITDRVELSEPTKEYYTFIGWTGTDLTEPTKNLVIENKIGNRTYVANYTPIDYSITYSGLLPTEIEELNNPTTYNIETTPINLNSPVDRTDEDGDKTKIFVGWKENDTTSTTITIPNLNSMGNKKFEAIWTPASPNTYTITYNLNGGTTSQVNPTSYTKKTETFTLINPTKEGSTFKGWSGTGLNGDNNLTVKVVKGTRGDLSFEANYVPNTYQIIFNKNGSNVSGSMSNQTITYDSTEVLNDVLYSKEGYTFTSWNTKEDGSGTTYNNKAEVLNLTSTNNGTVNLYAQWTPNSYKIRFNSNESTATGTMPDFDMVYDTAKTLPLNAFSVQGYSFDSWNTKNDGTGTVISNGESVINIATSGIVNLYAKWLPRNDTSYKIEYYQENIYDSDYSLYETEYKTGTTDTLANADIKTYENFTYDENNSQNILSGNIERDGSLVLKVYYKRNIHTVRLNSNGGSSVNNIEKKHGAKLLFAELPFPTKTPADFLGWFTDIEQGELIDDDIIIDSNIVLYAHWTTPPLCRRATILHTDTCERVDNAGCKKAGYTLTGTHKSTTIVYGNTSGENLTSGDAFDCDVNGDGIYNPDNERFYYIKTNDDNAVMVFYSNFEGENGVQTINNFVYDDAISQLPTLDQWSYVATEYDGKAARLLKADEVITACGVQPGSSTLLTKCDYMLENTSFRIDNIAIVRTGIWIEKYNDNYYRLQSSSLLFNTNTTRNVVRPVIDVPISRIDNTPITEYTVTFDSKGGKFTENNSNILTETVNNGSYIRILPTPTKTNAEFLGWYTDTQYTEMVSQPLEINSNNTYYAKWSYQNSVAVTNDIGYDTLQEAITAVEENGGEFTEVELLKDTEEKVTITGGRKVKIDLQNNIVTNDDDNNIFIVENGTLDISNGVLTSTASTNAVIDVNQSGTLNTSNLVINANGERQAIYNNGGTVTIMDGTNLTGKAEERAVVHNRNNGTTTILGGSIISTKLYAVYNEGGSLTIGEKDTSIKKTPVIQGKTYGVVAYAKYNFYDGIIKGKTAPVGKTSSTGNTPTVSTDTNETKINDLEDDSQKINENESDSSFKVLYLETQGSKYIITLDPGEGTVSPTSLVINAGSPLEYLPTPTNGQFTFDGWFDSDTNLEVDINTIPNGNKTYYAKWIYIPEHTEFNLINDTMKTYFTSISSWKNNQSSFQTNMDNNFNSNSCQSCDANSSNPYQSCPIYNEDGKKQCDRPNGFDTGVNSDVNVYLSNENTKEKGELVNYVTVTNGVIYNMIPGETYYWESTSNTNIYGTVKVIGNRRIIDAGAVRNVRDLGGLSVDTDGDGTVDGKLKYGKIFRGVRLATNSDITSLEKLGITEEIDLRGNQSDPKLQNYLPLAITNYEIDTQNYLNNYKTLRNALSQAMDDVINGENIFFHCKIGTDRTGTFAYFLEGLLGVSEEDRLQDYELSYFYGLLNRHRFYSNQPGSTITHRFTYMHDLYPTNEDIYEFYMYGATSSSREADIERVNNFRNAMINYN